MIILLLVGVYAFFLLFGFGSLLNAFEALETAANDGSASISLIVAILLFVLSEGTRRTMVARWRHITNKSTSDQQPVAQPVPIDPSKFFEEAKKNREALAKKLVNETMRELKAKMTANNFATSKKKLTDILGLVRSNNVDVPKSHENALVAELKQKYEDVLRKDLQKEEQRRIKERIREEQRFEKERQRELKRLEVEQKAIEDALAKALKGLEDEHSEEVERLRAQLREAEERSIRAKSQAELTRAGHVYVISNIGSFGDDVYKVGMTRRLEPLDRVRELGDASVPFSFDVHMMISCDDAPALENALHKDLNRYQVNRINPRKEFFKVSLDTIRDAVERHHGVVEYMADPEALEYYESLSMSDEDYAFIAKEQAAFEGQMGTEYN